MKRNEWTFDYDAEKLAEAAKAKRDAHERKKEWWEAKKVEVMQKVRATGIDIRDSVASGYSSTKGNFGPQIEIDAGMQRDLTECQQKIFEHDKLIRDYDGWLQVLTAHEDDRLSLDHEDFLFFYGN